MAKIKALTKQRKILFWILLTLIIATLAFIWGNSVESGVESDTKSEGVLEVIKPPLEVVVGKGNVTNHLVRKLAHFVEFALLGCEMMALCLVRKRFGIQSVVNCLFAGLGVAVIDETIQIFSNRGSQVQDVLLDFGGIATGVFFVCVLALLVRKISSKKHNTL